jgi:hypothetical protein
MAKIINDPPKSIKAEFTQDEWNWITACVANNSVTEIKNYFEECNVQLNKNFDSMELYGFLLEYSKFPE